MPIEVRGLAPLLQVYDMPTSIHFYRDLLGFELVSHAPEYAPGRFHWALLRLNGVELMLNTKYEFDDQRPPKHIEKHDVGLYFGCPDVDAAYRHVRSRSRWIADLTHWDRKRTCAWLIPKKENGGRKSG